MLNGGKMEFDFKGLYFDAWEGGMIVSKDGEDVMRVIDVFRKGVPPKDEIIKFYNALVKMSGESK
jgi:hypothetical protein